MRSSGRVVSVTSAVFAFLLFAPLSARAQFRTMGHVASVRPAFHAIHVRPSPTHGVAVGRAHIATAAPRSFPPASTPVAPANRFSNTFGAGSGETLQQLLDPVPGLGFDYAHLAAINSDLQIKAVIDPETEWRLAVAERVARATGGFASPGYYFLDGGGTYIVPESPASAQPPQQPQQTRPVVIVLQQPASAAKPAQESAPPAAQQTSAPIPDISNFTLVMHSGKKVQAIACTRVGGQIVYITPDGARHSIAAGELDSAATQRVNQASGTQLRL
jgi:hypothetical protein